MKTCARCGKIISREDGGPEIQGLSMTATLEARTPENIEYNNLQLGKYSDGQGGCAVSVCFECHIDLMLVR